MNVNSSLETSPRSERTFLVQGLQDIRHMLILEWKKCMTGQHLQLLIMSFKAHAHSIAAGGPL